MTHGPVETLATHVTLADGLFHIVSKGVVSTDESVSATIEAATRLAGGRRHPVLFDARIWPGGDPRGWLAVINQMRAVFSAGSMIVDPAMLESLSERFDPLGRLLIPFRVFTNEDEALAFLEPFKNSD
ncbi:MAG: hypothetical protein JJE47_15510 [Acidimicrobiia bacterium]|nr:hypothetical protein [Acidimicrobiia bacterium]